jgi:dienelactone hydrolase
VLRFAERVAAVGMTVWCPNLFGQAGREIDAGYAMRVMLKTLCVRREFNVWSSGKSSPIVDWLRALARKAHADCGGKGVGAVGMCFTGGFALAMMTEPSVVAPVVSQPSMPIPTGPGGKGRAAGVDVSPAEFACIRQRLADEDLNVIGLRFHDDSFVPPERFETLKRELGDHFEAIELDPKDARPARGMAPHSVLTLHLAEDGPTKAAEQRVLAFFRERTGAAAL